MRGVNGDGPRASIRSLRAQLLRLRRGHTLRTFKTRRGATLTLVGDDLQQERGGLDQPLR